MQSGSLTLGEGRQERSAFAAGAVEVEQVSEPMTIGRHDWRLTAYWAQSQEYVGEQEAQEDGTGAAGYRTVERRFTGFEWRRAGDGGPWCRDTEWPRYDADNGETAGLPRTLRRLWARCPWAHGRGLVRKPTGKGGLQPGPEAAAVE